MGLYPQIGEPGEGSGGSGGSGGGLNLGHVLVLLCVIVMVLLCVATFLTSNATM